MSHNSVTCSEIYCYDSIQLQTYLVWCSSQEFRMFELVYRNQHVKKTIDVILTPLRYTIPHIIDCRDNMQVRLLVLEEPVRFCGKTAAECLVRKAEVIFWISIESNDNQNID